VIGRWDFYLHENNRGFLRRSLDGIILVIQKEVVPPWNNWSRGFFTISTRENLLRTAEHHHHALTMAKIIKLIP